MTTEKSLKEVWTWKDAVNNDTKDLNEEEQLTYFKDKSENFLESCGFKKKIVSDKIYKLEKK